MKVPNLQISFSVSFVSLSRLQNEGSQPGAGSSCFSSKSIKATE